jgi:hypothetical protein
MFGSLLSSLSDFGSASLFDTSMSNHSCDINPASGLPMMGSIDVAGNPFGCDDSMSSSSSFGSSSDW